MNDELNKVPIAKTMAGTTLSLDFGNPSNGIILALMGASGCGKSSMLASILCSVVAGENSEEWLRNSAIYAVDGKLGLGLDHLSSRICVVGDDTEFVSTIDKFLTFMKVRQGQMRERGITCVTSDDYTADFKHVIFLFDEMNNICTSMTSQEQKHVFSVLNVILSQARSCGISVICSAHTFAADTTLSTQARMNFRQRAVFSCPDENVAKTLVNDMDKAPANLLSINDKGIAYITLDGASVWQKGRGWYVSEQEAKAVMDAHSLDKVGMDYLDWAVSSPS